MGSSISTDDEEILYIRDIKDEKIKENTEKYIKEKIKKNIGPPTFLVDSWYYEINPKNKKERYCLDQNTLIKIMKQLTTSDYIISCINPRYWNVSFVQKNSFLA